MFSENLKTKRKEKGFSQEALAGKLNVVRQTVSKWEKGLSVPDADMLIKISQLLEVSVTELLGAKPESEADMPGIAEELSKISQQLAIKNRRSKKIWNIVIGIAAAIILLNILFSALAMISASRYMENKTSVVTEIISLEPEE